MKPKKTPKKSDPRRPNQMVISFKPDDEIREVLENLSYAEEVNLSAAARMAIHEWITLSENAKIYRFAVYGQDNVHVINAEKDLLRELRSLNVALYRLRSNLRRAAPDETAFWDLLANLDDLSSRVTKILDFYSSSIVAKIPLVIPWLAKLVEGSIDDADDDPVYQFVFQLIQDMKRFCSSGEGLK